mmetsp:Transcript_74081/g.120277  ORF Transcript_74081/g.120277 Transcript_74081/m.120277 type:complete len:326 (-) Transcript_74081:2072-3049(-)
MYRTVFTEPITHFCSFFGANPSQALGDWIGLCSRKSCGKLRGVFRGTLGAVGFAAALTAARLQSGVDPILGVELGARGHDSEHRHLVASRRLGQEACGQRRSICGDDLHGLGQRLDITIDIAHLHHKLTRDVDRGGPGHGDSGFDLCLLLFDCQHLLLEPVDTLTAQVLFEVVHDGGIEVIAQFRDLNVQRRHVADGVGRCDALDELFTGQDGHECRLLGQRHEAPHALGSTLLGDAAEVRGFLSVVEMRTTAELHRKLHPVVIVGLGNEVLDRVWHGPHRYYTHRVGVDLAKHGTQRLDLLGIPECHLLPLQWAPALGADDFTH